MRLILILPLLAMTIAAPLIDRAPAADPAEVERTLCGPRGLKCDKRSVPEPEQVQRDAEDVVAEVEERTLCGPRGLKCDKRSVEHAEVRA